MDLIWTVLRELLTPENGWSVRLARAFGSRTLATFTACDFLSNVAAGSLVASAIPGRSVVKREA